MKPNIHNTELCVKFCQNLGEDVVLARESADKDFHCLCSEICKSGQNCEHYNQEMTAPQSIQN